MSETPTFGRYAEIPYDEMTPEQQSAYQGMIETRGRLPGPSTMKRYPSRCSGVMRSRGGSA